MQDLSPNESKLIEKNRASKGYESTSEDQLLIALIVLKKKKVKER